MKNLIYILIAALALFIVFSCTSKLIAPDETDSKPKTEPSCIKYERDLYLNWIDEDEDCQNTRHEVLNEENHLGKSDSCKIKTGLWIDPYTGLSYTDPADIDIDHMVPLSEAHRSGASHWSADKKMAFANDLDLPQSLVAIYKGENRSKSDKDPANWLPDSSKYWKTYIKDWIKVKSKWDLNYDSLEIKAIKKILGADTSEFNLPTPIEESNCDY